MNLFDRIKSLYDGQMYEDVNLLCSMALSQLEHDPDALSCQNKEANAYQNKIQLLIMYGHSLYHMAEHKKAEGIFKKVLQMKKMMKAKSRTTQQDMSSDVDVRFALYKVYNVLKQPQDAIATLEGISSKHRTAQISMALAKLYHKQGGLDRAAITSYKEVLRECPLSLTAAEGLLALDVKVPEVYSLMIQGLQGAKLHDWLATWLDAQAHGASRDYPAAIACLKSLDYVEKDLKDRKVKLPFLRDNPELVCNLGYQQFLHGQYSEAMINLQKAQETDPMLLKHMDVLAYLFYREKKEKELEALSTGMMAVTKKAVESWVAMGYFALATRRVTQASFFAQKAVTMDSRSVEAILLKGVTLIEMKKIREAIVQYREAHRIAPHRYEAYRGLVECYLATSRLREATNMAHQALIQQGNNTPRCLTLYANTLSKEPATVEKAKNALERALKQPGTYLEAVYLMAEILHNQGQLDKGIELLRKQLQRNSTARLHQMLGDFLSKTNEHQEALDQYNIALSLDPNNQKVREGMERVEKHGDMGMDSTYDVEVDDNTDNEAGLEGSDWSDIDLM